MPQRRQFLHLARNSAVAMAALPAGPGRAALRHDPLDWA